MDSNLKYFISVEGAESGAAKFRLVGNAAKQAATAVNSTSSASANGAKNINKLGDASNGTAKAVNSAAKAQEGYFAHIAKTTVQSALINKLFLEFVDVSGQAVQQVDLMNNFPATMASMGQSTKDAQVAMQALSSYIGQVGGNLGQATSMVTRFTGVTKDVKSATAILQGLNNALIAGDTTLEEQKNAAIQFGQALERGKPDMREWNTLSTVMSQQLGIVADAMGYVNANALGQALRDGEVSMGEFTTELTKLSTGTGPIAEQAMARMSGMQFAFNVMKNTMVQGLAAIINAFGRSNIVGFFNFLTQVIRVLTQWVINLINVLGSLANILSGLFGGGDVFKKITGDLEPGIKSGANAADDLGKNLKGAKEEADDIKKSLAGFDKMNVLPEPTTKKKKDDAIGDAGFNPAMIGELGDLLGKMGGNIGEASKWAKIFAGVLTGLAANTAVNKLFGVNPLADFTKGVKNVASSVGSIADKAKGTGKSFRGMWDSFQLGMMGVADEKGINGVFGRIGKGIANIGKLAATAFSNPITLVILAIAAIITALKVLYDKNAAFAKGWDSIWSSAGKVVSSVANIFKHVFGPAIDQFKKAWTDLLTAINPLVIRVDALRVKFIQWLDAILPGNNALEFLGKAIGVIAAVIVGVLLAPLALLITALSALAYGAIWVATKIVQLATIITNGFGAAKDAIKDFTTGGIDLIRNSFNGARDAITGFIRDGIDALKTKFDEFKAWIEEHKQALINWGIVITTLLLPKIVQIGIEFAKSAATAIVEFARMAAASIASAAQSSAAWVTTELPRILRAFAVMSARAVVEAAKTSGAWILSSARSGASFAAISARAVVEAGKTTATFVASSAKSAASFVKMGATFILTLVKMTAQLVASAVRMAAAWLLSMGPWGLIIALVAGAIALIIANWDTVREVVDEVWQGVQNAVDSAMGWIRANWPLILAILTGPIGLAVLAIVKNWDKIKATFNSAWQSIKTTWNDTVAFFGRVWSGIVIIFSTVKEWFQQKFQEAWIAVQIVWNAAGDFFSNIWTGIKGAFGDVAGWFASVFQNAWNRITGIFGGLWTWFKVNVWDKIVSLFSTIGTSVADAVSGAFKGVINTVLKGVLTTINGFINTLNTAINAVNKISPKNMPTVPPLPIPQLAKGGLVEQATLAMVGENGAEAVMPLENNTEWIDKLAAKISVPNSNNTDTRIPSKLDDKPANNITIQVSGVFATSVSEQRKVADLIAKRIKESLGSRSPLGV